MADTVDVQVILNDGYHYIVRLLGESDSTGESGVKKIDISALSRQDNGEVPLALDLCSVNWAVSTGESVKLSWDASADDEIVILAGTGEIDFRKYGGPLKDPRSATPVGDVLLTTIGAASTDTYNIVADFELRSENT